MRFYIKEFKKRYPCQLAVTRKGKLYAVVVFEREFDNYGNPTGKHTCYDIFLSRTTMGLTGKLKEVMDKQFNNRGFAYDHTLMNIESSYKANKKHKRYPCCRTGTNTFTRMLLWDYKDMNFIPPGSMAQRLVVTLKNLSEHRFNFPGTVDDAGVGYAEISI